MGCGFGELKAAQPRPRSVQQGKGNSLKTHGTCLSKSAFRYSLQLANRACLGSKRQRVLAPVRCAAEAGGGAVCTTSRGGRKWTESSKPLALALKGKVCFLCKSPSPKCSGWRVLNPLRKKKVKRFSGGNADANFSHPDLSEAGKSN